MASMPHARLDLHDPCRDLTHRGAVWRCEVDESADESVWKMRSKLDWCYLMLDSPKIFSNLWSSFFTVSTKNTQMGFWIMSRWWQNSVGLVGLDVQNANMDLFKQRWKWLSINKVDLESPFLILQCFFLCHWKSAEWLLVWSPIRSIRIWMDCTPASGYKSSADMATQPSSKAVLCCSLLSLCLFW